MKNKKLTYFLIVIVAGVWGLIIYRVFEAVGPNDDGPVAALSQPAKEAFNDFSIPKDTTHLLLNYRDPFGITKPKDTIDKPIRVSKSKFVPVQAKQQINWSFITYSGYVRNPASKKLVALVSINGQNLTLSEGETRSQVKLLKNLKDSIKISYGGKIKFIALKSATL
jgi:hypothetical protein